MIARMIECVSHSFALFPLIILFSLMIIYLSHDDVGRGGHHGVGGIAVKKIFDRVPHDGFHLVGCDGFVGVGRRCHIGLDDALVLFYTPQSVCTAVMACKLFFPMQNKPCC